MNKSKIAGILSGVAIVLAGCGGFVYTTVGGTVTGLGTSGTNTVGLKNEGNYTQVLSADGSFSFTEASNAQYTISVYQQPRYVNCSVANGTGTMNSSTGVANVAVTCVPNVQINGNLSGLADGSKLYLINNITNPATNVSTSADNTPAGAISANGTFVLPTWVVSGYNYNVTVALPPPGQYCTVANGTGVADNNPKLSPPLIGVNCVTAVPVTFTVTGLTAGNSVTLTNTSIARKEGDPLTVSTIGTYNFSWSLLTGMNYSVAVTTQPNGQTCTVQNGNGTANLANPGASANIAVTCQ
ncbi:hypothetical protein H8K32_00800 [Undibacterium jejuense]|uniref:Uncharacterized protein n=1 Tax=Undibacterium jejuense TaxID=1344949 RepID=A0A923KMY2_9BURK|nr:hypothetical protein [Undibacterium jejuense]MBC3860624.1 hypothetical protein [Undibacterium jejuense]